ncbi:hypothetical protein BGX38DRAFT_1234074 [Terfezia claveryi]|nr:hypothetical protein BGX38DRAFT_1234074 [Terfezia claveryi]
MDPKWSFTSPPSSPVELPICEQNMNLKPSNTSLPWPSSHVEASIYDKNTDIGHKSYACPQNADVEDPNHEYNNENVDNNQQIPDTRILGLSASDAETPFGERTMDPTSPDVSSPSHSSSHRVGPANEKKDKNMDKHPQILDTQLPYVSRSELGVPVYGRAVGPTWIPDPSITVFQRGRTRIEYKAYEHQPSLEQLIEVGLAGFAGVVRPTLPPSTPSSDVETPMETRGYAHEIRTVIPGLGVGNDPKTISEIDIAIQQHCLYFDYATAFIKKQVTAKIDAGEVSAEDPVALEECHRRCTIQYWDFTSGRGYAISNGLMTMHINSENLTRSYKHTQFDPVRELSTLLIPMLADAFNKEALCNKLVRAITHDGSTGRFNPAENRVVVSYALPNSFVSREVIMTRKRFRLILSISIFHVLIDYGYACNNGNPFVKVDVDFQNATGPLSWMEGEEEKLQSFIDQENGIIEEIADSEESGSECRDGATVGRTLRHKRKGKQLKRQDAKLRKAKNIAESRKPLKSPSVDSLMMESVNDSGKIQDLNDSAPSTSEGSEPENREPLTPEVRSGFLGCDD